MTEAKFEFECPKCSAVVAVPELQSGQTIACQRCAHQMLIPGRTESAGRVTVDDLLDVDDGIMHSSDALPVAADTTEDLEEQTESLANSVSDEHDDVDELLPLTPQARPEALPEEAKDPFEIDKDAPLKIEGITPGANTVVTRCHLCLSAIFATPSQVGQELRCPDCHTMVPIKAPTAAQLKLSPGDLEQPAESGELTLGPVMERPRVDADLVRMAEPIAIDIDQTIKVREPLPPLPSEFDEGTPAADEAVESLQSAQTSAPGQEDSDSGEAGYHLAEPETDLLKPNFDYSTPAGGADAAQSTEAPDKPKDVLKPASTRMVEPADDNEVTVIPDDDPPRRRTTPAENAEFDDLPSPFVGFFEWITKALGTLMSKEVWVRGVFVGIGLGIAYCIVLFGISLLSGNLAAALGGFLTIAFGSVIGLLSLGYLCVIGDLSIRRQVNPEMADKPWPDASISEWTSHVLFMGLSLLAAAAPGLLFGQVVFALTKSVAAMLLFPTLSFFLLQPIFLASALFNDSPYQLLSTRVLSTLSTLGYRWIRFATFSVAIAFLVWLPTLALTSASPVSGIFIALVQVALWLFYLAALGTHVADVINRLLVDAEQNG